jgi:hypothetical protein
MTVTENAPTSSPFDLPAYPSTVVSEMAYARSNSTITLYYRPGDENEPRSLGFEVPVGAWGCFDNAPRLYYGNGEFEVAMWLLVKHVTERRNRILALIEEHQTTAIRARRSKERIAERLRDYAVDIGWCSEYETWAEENGGLTRNKTWTVTAEFTVEAMTEDEACDEVGERLHMVADSIYACEA